MNPIANIEVQTDVERDLTAAIQSNLLSIGLVILAAIVVGVLLSKGIAKATGL